MDDADLVKAGVEGFTSAALAPFTDLISKLFGPSAEKVGLISGDIIGMLGEEVRLRVQRRMQPRFLRLLQRTRDMMFESGQEPQEIEPKVLVPLLENGSLEEDDELQDRWAALLVSASSGTRVPGAIEILKQLTTDDVQLLQLCYDFVQNIKTTTWQKQAEASFGNYPLLPPFDSSEHDLSSALEKREHDIAKRAQSSWPETPKFGKPAELYVYLDNVTRLGLIIVNNEKQRRSTDSKKYYVLSRLGYSFVAACQLPG